MLADLMGNDLSEWHVDEEWLFSLSLLAETCALVGETARAAPLYDLLAPHAALNAIAVPEGALDSTHRPLGILAAMLERYDAAAEHFEAALAMNERMGALPWLAHTRLAYAEMLDRRAGPGDRDQAAQLRSQAHATYAELGIQVPVTGT
jgi:tetratricopeptide (TPR) repeat protein